MSIILYAAWASISFQIIVPILKLVVQVFFVCGLSCRHEVAETAGLISHSFGVDDDDKYIILFKKVHSYAHVSL